MTISVLPTIGRAVEIAGVAVIALGAAAATVQFAAVVLTARSPLLDAYRTYRQWLGRSILLGLEFLVAADIVGTVAIQPTLSNLAVLGGIVLIRTILSTSLEMEIEGDWPWRRRRTGMLMRSAGAGRHDE